MTRFAKKMPRAWSSDDDVYELACIAVDVSGTKQNEIWTKIRNDVQIFDAYYQHCKKLLQSLYPQLEVTNLKLFKPQLQSQNRSAEDWYAEFLRKG